MKYLLALNLFATGALAHARAYYVYDGRVVIGRRADGQPARRAMDLALARIASSNASLVRRIARLPRGRAFLCELEGSAVLVGVDAISGEMISQFRARSVGACHLTSTRAMLGAN